MAKNKSRKLSKLLSAKSVRKALKKHPFGAAAALFALGSAATAVGSNSPLSRLKDGALRRLKAARNAMSNDERVAQHH